MYSMPNDKEEQQHRTTLTSPGTSSQWEELGADFLYFDGKKFLLIIDYFSKYLYVPQMKKTTAEATINRLKHIFYI